MNQPTQTTQTTQSNTDTDTDTIAESDVSDTEVQSEARESGALEPGTIEVRRNGALAAGVAGVCALVGVAYLGRALAGGSVVDWLVAAVLLALAGVNTASWRDSRTPLLVADRTGVRVRLGRTWQGLPWNDVEEIEHAPRRGMLRDGRLVAFPVDATGLVEKLDIVATAQARVTEQVHGAPFAVPLGLTTTVVGADGGLTAALLALVPDPEMVVEVVPGAADAVSEPTTASATEEVVDEPGGATEDTPRGNDEAVQGDDEDTAIRPMPVVATETPAPERAVLTARRSEQTRVRVMPAMPEVADLDRDAHDYFTAGPDDTGVWRSTTVVIDEQAGPAREPVIGPVLAEARMALGLGVDRLAERTRIRPHVIESIEIDDFEPCGGDFYARGHLRTLARVLGVDVAPLLAIYDERYVEGPLEARKVFEADLATSSAGAIRSLRGGPNWSMLVAVVMAVVLAWSVARLVADRPEAVDDSPSLSRDSAGLTSAQTATSPPVPVLLTAEGGGAKVVVRDGDGTVVFKGDLAFGRSKTVQASAPVRVQTSDGSLTVGLDGATPKRMGRAGESARATYVPETR